MRTRWWWPRRNRSQASVGVLGRRDRVRLASQGRASPSGCSARRRRSGCGKISALMAGLAPVRAASRGRVIGNVVPPGPVRKSMLAAVLADQLLGQGQAPCRSPGPWWRSRAGRGWSWISGGIPGPRVADRHPELAVLDRGAERQLAPSGHRLQGVDAPGSAPLARTSPGRAATGGSGRSARHELEPDVLLGRLGADQADDVLEHPSASVGLEGQALQAGEVAEALERRR